MSASDIHDRAHVETDRPAGSLHPTARFHGRKRTGIQPTNHRATDSLGRQPKPRSTHEGRLPTIDQGPPMPTELRRACNGGVDGNRTQRTSCFVVPSRAVKCRLSRANAACWCCPVSPGDGYAATFCQHGSAAVRQCATFVCPTQAVEFATGGTALLLRRPRTQGGVRSEQCIEYDTLDELRRRLISCEERRGSDAGRTRCTMWRGSTKYRRIRGWQARTPLGDSCPNPRSHRSDHRRRRTNLVDLDDRATAVRCAVAFMAAAIEGRLSQLHDRVTHVVEWFPSTVRPRRPRRSRSRVRTRSA